MDQGGFLLDSKQNSASTGSPLKEAEFNHDALVEKTNTLLDEVERVGDSWHSGKDSTESLRQLRILASGYIQSLEQALASMGECMNQVLDENARLLHANGEIAAAAEVMEELARGLVEKESA